LSKKSETAETAGGKVTPLMRQYYKIKSKYPDAILLFRVGDFYETFGEDAKKAAEILGIVLTSRNNGGNDTELAGFPYHAMDIYLPKLVQAGYRVAICEQLEKPSKEKKIVKRGVTEMVTPGLTLDDKLLDHRKNNFLASIHVASQEKIGIAFLDVSTGEFLVSEGNVESIDKLLQSFLPSEVIFAKGSSDWFDKKYGDQFYRFTLDDWVYTLDFAREKLLSHFEVLTLKGFSVEELSAAQIAAGAALQYLTDTAHGKLQHIQQISRIHPEEHLWMDRFTIRNLELLHPAFPTGKALIDVVDSSVTPMGSRLMRKWLLLPLCQLKSIHRRLEIVTYWIGHPETREEMISQMRAIGDLERLVSKISMGKVNPREILQLKKALHTLVPMKQILVEGDLPELQTIGDSIQLCEKLANQISMAIADDPPALLSKGDVIRGGFNEELDDLRHTIRNSKELLVEIQQHEAKRTGIQNLKIGFNNVFGYYLEVTNRYKDQGLIPPDWVRKQTLTNAERYVTEELKKLEQKILGAEEQITIIEEQLYLALINTAQEYIAPIQHDGYLVAQLDCLIAFAQNALKNQYCRPEVNDSYHIDIKAGRHPVIERQLPLGESYVPNDVFLDCDTQQLLMITGPNMSGKSALLRQTALICIMAQMGSYVPATSASLGFLDKLFTRVGASDNISSGESTFMVEMNETASIMNNVSQRSLILLDEIGRGTSTYDGISIAWSVAEYLHDNPYGRPKTLFATHYHELNALTSTHERIKNFHVATQETDNKVLFLRTLVEGGTEHSFGIHVAKMAGMPKSILFRAQRILVELEKKETEIGGQRPKVPAQNPMQLSIFEHVDPLAAKLKEMIADLNINQLTPVECMLKLIEMKKFMDEEG
jgi:DNA mismatch repair protein MutS